MLALLLAFAAARPAAAQSVLRDSETELLFRDISRPLITAAGLDPKSTNVVLLNDPEINAFVATGQTVYIQSGLLVASDNVNQLQGVIAHELGHVAGGHSIRMARTAPGEATGITIATLVLGALAIAAGRRRRRNGHHDGRPAGRARPASWPSPAPRKARPISAGAKYLSAAGISGKGSLEFFKKLQNQEYPPRGLREGQLRPHPPAVERAHHALLAGLPEGPGVEPAARSGARGALPAGQGQAHRLCRPQARGHANIPRATRASRRIMRAPTPIISAPIRTKRCREADALLAAAPDDPFFLELKGQILLESGKPAEAIAPLREAVAALGRPAADRGDARPCADRDREAGEFRRGQASAQGGGQPRQPEPVRLVSAGHHLRPRGRPGARRAGDRRAQQPRGQAQARAGQRGNGAARAFPRARPTIFGRRTSPWCRARN